MDDSCPNTTRLIKKIASVLRKRVLGERGPRAKVTTPPVRYLPPFRLLRWLQGETQGAASDAETPFSENPEFACCMGRGACTCLKWKLLWNHFSLRRRFPSFIVFFASKLDIFPLKRSVFWVSKGPFSGLKRTNVDFGLQDPTTAHMPVKKGENQQDRN